MSITFRLAKIDDFDDVSKIVDHLHPMKDVGTNDAKKLFVQIISEDYPTIVFSDDKPVAYGCFSIENKIWGKIGHIEDIVVLPNFRKKGFAKILIEEFISLAKHKGCYKVLLTTRIELLEMYEKFGFREWESCLRLNP